MKPYSVAIVFLLSTTISVFGADFYVSTAGSDTNPGTQAQPFATIQHAIDACPAPPTASTVHLDASTWNESPTAAAKVITIIGDYNGPNGMGGRTSSIVNGLITFTSSASSCVQTAKYLTAQGFWLHTWTLITVDSCNITLQGIYRPFTTDPGLVTITNCIVSNNNIEMSGSSNVNNCTVHDCDDDGIYISGECYHNTVYNCNGWGINLYEGVALYNNICHNNSLGGIICYNTSNIYGNNIYSNLSCGMQINSTVSKVYNNTIQNNQSFGIYITDGDPDLGGGELGSPGNNTISGNGTYEVYNASPNNIYAKNNHWDSQSEGEMAGGYYNTVNVTRIWDKWEDGSKGYIMWSDPNPTKAAAPSIGLIKATFYPSSNSVGHNKVR